jgi:hypothetical protein
MPKIVITVLVVWVVLIFGLVSALAGSDRGSGGEVVTNARPAATARAGSGVPADHIEQHARMTSQMRAAVPGARMQARMAGDPMWEMMRDPAHIRAEEEYWRGLDRMLARRP